MKIHWDIDRTSAEGGGWLVVRCETETVIDGDPASEDGARVHTFQKNKEYLSFTTLAHARKSIASELMLDKRVRLAKHNDTSYSYDYDNDPQIGF